MCSTCTTAFDTLAWNSAIGLAFATEGARKVRDRIRGRRPVDRAMADWSANADFVRSIGLDPLEVLGAPPLVPVEAHPPVPGTHAVECHVPASEPRTVEEPHLAH